MCLYQNIKKPIGLASDHAGFDAKKYIISVLDEKKIPYKDFGAYSCESCDYPDYAHRLGTAIDKDECEIGIAICGTGNGINMVLNKHVKVRAALCWKKELAYYAKAHNNANVLSLPGRLLSESEIHDILIVFLDTSFDGGRHQQRIDKIPI